MNKKLLIFHLLGIFIIFLICIYGASHWDRFNEKAKLALTFGTSFLALFFAIAQYKHITRKSQISILFGISIILQIIGIFTLYENSPNKPEIVNLIGFTILGLEQYLIFHWLRNNFSLLFTLLFSSSNLLTIGALLHIDARLMCLFLSIFLLSLSYKISKIGYNDVSGLGYFFGIIFLFLFSFLLLRNTKLEIYFLGLPALFIYISLMMKNRAILCASTYSAFVYICYFSYGHYAHSLGLTILLFLLFSAFISTCGFTFKMSKRILSKEKFSLP